MQSNVTSIIDDKNDFPDSWLELYNSGQEDVNIGAYLIGETQNHSEAYHLPDAIIPAGGHALIYLDKLGVGMHADFRLDSGKGEVWLLDAFGNSIDYLKYKKMPAFDVAYGRLSDGGEKWGYMLKPTPGGPNASDEASVIDAAPEFSVEGGLFDGAFALTVSMPSDSQLPEDAKLAVSLDGSWPMAGSESEAVLEIKETTVVRARIVSESRISGPVITHSYIFHPEPTNLAVVSIAADNDYFYSPTFGIFEGSDGVAPYGSNNWRRPINIEYFGGVDHACSINQVGETKVKGNWSRQFPQKSMVVYANKRFGSKRLNTLGIWADKPNVTEVKSFELRNSGQRFIFDHLCDQFAHRIGGRGSERLDWSAYRPVVCYVNGRYHGIYDLRERCNDDNIEANYNGLEDIDMVTDWNELDAGDENAIVELQRDFFGEDMTFSSLCNAMDMDSFVEMFILQWVLGNTDFPRHNIVSWRNRVGDRRWRWLLKDLDCIGVEGVNGDYIDFINVASDGIQSMFPKSNKAFKIVLNTKEGRNILIPRLMAAMGDYLREDRALAMIDEMAEEIAPEYARHLQRFYPDSKIYTYDYWVGEVNKRKKEIEGRSAAVIKQLQKHFGYGPVFELSIEDKGLPVYIAQQKVRYSDFSGKWFINQPLEIASPSSSIWKVTIVKRSGVSADTVVDSNKLNLFVDDAEVAKIELALMESSAIAPSLVAPEEELLFDVYDISGKKVRSNVDNFSAAGVLEPGMYIFKSANIVKKVIVR